jgi:hypothetical protein
MAIAEHQVLAHPDRFLLKFYADPIQAELSCRLLATVDSVMVAAFFAG